MILQWYWSASVGDTPTMWCPLSSSAGSTHGFQCCPVSSGINTMIPDTFLRRNKWREWGQPRTIVNCTLLHLSDDIAILEHSRIEFSTHPYSTVGFNNQFWIFTREKNMNFSVSLSPTPSFSPILWAGPNLPRDQRPRTQHQQPHTDHERERRRCSRVVLPLKNTR